MLSKSRGAAKRGFGVSILIRSGEQAAKRKGNIKPTNHMKTQTLLKMVRFTCATLACAALLPLSSQGADEMKAMKGGEHLMMLNNIETKKQLDSLKTGDTLTMVCAKCKTVWASRVRQGAKGAEVLMAKGQPQEVVGTHACKGCNSTLTTEARAGPGSSASATPPSSPRPPPRPPPLRRRDRPAG